MTLRCGEGRATRGIAQRPPPRLASAVLTPPRAVVRGARLTGRPKLSPPSSNRAAPRPAHRRPPARHPHHGTRLEPRPVALGARPTALRPDPPPRAPTQTAPRELTQDVSSVARRPRRGPPTNPLRHPTCSWPRRGRQHRGLGHRLRVGRDPCPRGAQPAGTSLNDRCAIRRARLAPFAHCHTERTLGDDACTSSRAVALAHDATAPPAGSGVPASQWGCRSNSSESRRPKISASRSS